MVVLESTIYIEGIGVRRKNHKGTEVRGDSNVDEERRKRDSFSSLRLKVVYISTPDHRTSLTISVVLHNIVRVSLVPFSESFSDHKH